MWNWTSGVIRATLDVHLGDIRWRDIRPDPQWWKIYLVESTVRHVCQYLSVLISATMSWMQYSSGRCSTLSLGSHLALTVQDHWDKSYWKWSCDARRRCTQIHPHMGPLSPEMSCALGQIKSDRSGIRFLFTMSLVGIKWLYSARVSRIRNWITMELLYSCEEPSGYENSKRYYTWLYVTLRHFNNT